jgi:hypothetical protein
MIAATTRKEVAIARYHLARLRQLPLAHIWSGTVGAVCRLVQRSRGDK